MKYAAAFCLFGVLLCGCLPADTAASIKGEPVVRPQFSDIPVPEGFEFLRELSDKHEWDWKGLRFGRLFYRGTLPVEETQRFYRRAMTAPDANWRETGFSSGKEVVISFEKGTGENRESCQVRITREDSSTVVIISLDPIGGK
jgi:hypothetical protein